MKVLKATDRSTESIKTELAKNPHQKILVNDGQVIMNSLELIEEEGNKVKLRDFKNMEIEIKCTDGNVFVNSFNERFSISKPTELSKQSFILGTYEEDNTELKQHKPNVDFDPKIKFDNKPFRFR